MTRSDDDPTPETATTTEPEGSAPEPADLSVEGDMSKEVATSNEAEGAGAATPEDASATRVKGGKKAKPKKAPKWTPPPPDRLDGALEAMLLVAGDVIRPERLRDLLGLPSVTLVKEALERVGARWEEQGLAVELEHVAKGVRVVTRPEFAEYVSRLQRKPPSDRLTKSLLETLSIVAYKQPVGRAEVERIRGVQGGEALRGLLDRGLLKVVGRSDQPGRPLLYGTTDRFLTLFGLASLKDLPSDGDLKRL